jgi:hypothetical protein
MAETSFRNLNEGSRPIPYLAGEVKKVFTLRDAGFPTTDERSKSFGVNDGP